MTISGYKLDYEFLCSYMLAIKIWESCLYHNESSNIWNRKINDSV